MVPVKAGVTKGVEVVLKLFKNTLPVTGGLAVTTGLGTFPLPRLSGTYLPSPKASGTHLPSWFTGHGSV